MAKKIDITADVATLSPEELLAFAKEAQAQVAELKKTSDEAVAKIAKFETDIETGTKALQEAETKVTTLQGNFNKLEADLEAALGENEELQKALENKPAKGALPEISHDGKKYLVMIPSFRHKGATHSADALRKDKALTAELVEMGSSVLKLKD